MHTGVAWKRPSVCTSFYASAENLRHTNAQMESEFWTFVQIFWLDRFHYRGNLLRSVPFLMAGHLNIKIFQTLGMPFFNTNPKNGCPKMICQYSGQAPRHFTCRFHYMSCSTDVRPWDSKRKFVFLLQIVPITKTLVPNAST